ncbi:MAG TPA: DNA strand exchange inhibitor protein, partial [Gemmataceae bacterium]|nr:DNA strand exchange inhibitor protein [Gemmataceae bacterium]
EEAEKARTEALSRQHDADRQKAEFERKVAELKQRQDEDSRLAEWRSRLRPGDSVYSPKFGKSGKVARVNQAKGTVFISVGIGQWEVFLNEVLPEAPKSD